ncbi:MAG TPA: S8 family serine peptidase, partial [Chitinophagaceae bacterium]|nr:S8 family serine peptidase [Chitinophagaceae bacterium]
MATISRQTQLYNNVTNDRLPIKVILPNQGAQKKNKGGGSSKLFRQVDKKYRQSLSNQVNAIKKSTTFNKIEMAPVRIKLLAKASAKSHRPEDIFSEETCPIVGSGSLGELFVKATPMGLDRLDDLILNNTADYIKKELSAIESIEPITPTFRKKGVKSLDILKESPKRDNKFVTRVKLFDLGNQNNAQENILNNFEESCSELNIEINSKGYSKSSYTYELRCKDVNDLDAVSNIIGVRSISQMPIMRIIKQKSLNPSPLPNTMPRRSINDDVPIVVVVDSGITTNNPDLNTWVVGNISDVAPEYRNTSHGTFVAGLICWGSTLNPTISGIDSNQCAVFDLQVIPNDDPEKGDVDELLENELLMSLETALQQYANKYKVWNLSLGSDYVCSLDEFSPLAESLDNLQERYQVSFVISAGNYEKLPMLSYPR